MYVQFYGLQKEQEKIVKDKITGLHDKFGCQKCVTAKIYCISAF
jgi:hypothetical protein